MAILPFKAHGQGTVTKVGQTRGIQENIGGEKVDSFLWLPLRIPATWTYTNVIIPNMGGLTQSPIDSNLYFQKYYNTWYRVITTNDTGSFGHGTVTSITATSGGGISATPNPIITTGTLSLTAVGTPTTVGSSTQIPVITTNAYGQISAMTYSTVASSGVTSVSAVSGGGIIATPNGITTTGTVQVDTGRIPTFYDTTAIGSGSNALATRFWAQKSFITGGYTWTGANTWTNTAGQTISISGSATNTVNGFYLLNPTAATSVTPQYAPALELSGYGFKTGTGGGSQSTIWQLAQSITNGASIVNTLTFASIVNGVSYTAMTINGSSTGVTFNGTITGNNGVSISAGLTLVSGAFKITTGSNRATGTATLSSGTVTVSNTLVTSSSLIWVQYQSGSTLSGATLTRILRVSSQTAGTSFTAVAETAPGTINTSDNSNIQWGIVN